MQRLVKQYSGQGRLIFEDNQAADVRYRIDEFEQYVSDGGGGEMPTRRDRRGQISNVEGHPDWHPITYLHPGPFTLVTDDGRKLKVIVKTSQGSIHGTGDFF